MSDRFWVILLSSRSDHDCPGHRSGEACARGRRRAREAARVPGARRSPARRMRLSVFQCPGLSPVVIALSRESRAQAGALVVIHPKIGQSAKPKLIMSQRSRCRETQIEEPPVVPRRLQNVLRLSTVAPRSDRRSLTTYPRLLHATSLVRIEPPRIVGIVYRRTQIVVRVYHPTYFRPIRNVFCIERPKIGLLEFE
jgi:hypothetical protein